MEKRKISAKDLVADIKDGLTYESIKDKYLLSEQTLDNFFGKIVQSGLVQSEELPTKTIRPEPSKNSQHPIEKRRIYTRLLPPRKDKLQTPWWLIVGLAVAGCLFILMLKSLFSPTAPHSAPTSSKTFSSDHERCVALNAERCRIHRAQLKAESEARARGETFFDVDKGFLGPLGDEMEAIGEKMDGCEKYSDIDWKCLRQ